MMGRPLRTDLGDMFYHVINRGNFRSLLFANDSEYSDFINILSEALVITPMRIVAYCLMPNHWHMILHPTNDGDLSKFIRWITLTHTQRYHAKTKTVGHGHIYQGRYKSFLIGNDVYFNNVFRYVEANAKRAKMVDRAELWPWSSAYARIHAEATGGQDRILKGSWNSYLDAKNPKEYLDWLNGGWGDGAVTDEIENIRKSVQRGRPYGSEAWMAAAIERFSLEGTIRDPWRPKKVSPQKGS